MKKRNNPKTAELKKAAGFIPAALFSTKYLVFSGKFNVCRLNFTEMKDCLEKSVAARFSAAAGTYDDNAIVQRSVAEKLISLADVQENIFRILEIGCGSGMLTKHISEKFPSAGVVALDISEKMVQRAEARMDAGKNISFMCQDIIRFNEEEKFDMAFSASSLHWIRPVAAATKKIHGLLRHGGHLVCAVMVEGTLGELRAARRFVAPAKLPEAELPSENDTRNALLSAGFRVEHEETVTVKVEYENAFSFLRAIHDQGVTGGYPSIGKKPLTRDELGQLADYYDRTYRGESGVYASYLAYFVKAEKP